MHQFLYVHFTSLLVALVALANPQESIWCSHDDRVVDGAMTYYDQMIKRLGCHTFCCCLVAKSFVQLKGFSGAVISCCHFVFIC